MTDVGKPRADAAASSSAEDAPRRTYLANERTYLAWWRTGVGAVGAGIALAKVIPSVSHQAHLPYAILGAGFALIGVAALVYGLYRESQVRRAIDRGGFAPTDERALGLFTVAACALGVFGLVLVLADM